MVRVIINISLNGRIGTDARVPRVGGEKEP